VIVWIEHGWFGGERVVRCSLGVVADRSVWIIDRDRLARPLMEVSRGG